MTVRGGVNEVNGVLLSLGFSLITRDTALANALHPWPGLPLLSTAINSSSPAS